MRVSAEVRGGVEAEMDKKQERKTTVADEWVKVLEMSRRVFDQHNEHERCRKVERNGESENDETKDETQRERAKGEKQLERGDDVRVAEMSRQRSDVWR